MRFACQSCGKAYNLPEERIAEKSNVKLKCRVCGAIVEVKRQGELVAQVLTDGEAKRGRVSEAPAPLASLSPDDGDDATSAIAVGDQILSEQGTSDQAAFAALEQINTGLNHRGLPPLPAPPPTGFASPPTGFAMTPVPPPLAQPGSVPLAPPPPRLESSPRAEALSWAEPHAPPLPNMPAASIGSPPPPPLLARASGSESALNGSNGAGSRAGGDAMYPLPDELRMPALGGASTSNEVAVSGALNSMVPELSGTAAGKDDTTMKMLAALATGILIGFIIAKLFF